MKFHQFGMAGILRSVALAALFAVGLTSIVATTPGSSSDPRGAKACAGRDQQVRTGSVVHLDASCTSLSNIASDDDFLQFRWSIENRPAGSRATLSDNTVVNPFFTADVDGVYRFKVTARSDSLVTGDESLVTITAGSGNVPPVAHAGDSFEAKVGDNPTLDGSRSSDADGDLLTYAWMVEAPGQPINLFDDETATPAFDTPVATIYRFSLTVDDGLLDSKSNQVSVRVTQNFINACPNADAGPNQRVATGTQVTLDASASRDADGDQLGYDWRMTYRPVGSSAALDDPGNNANPSFTPDVDGAYVIRLTANDADTSRGLTANCISRLLDLRDTVTVIASSGNSGPVADAGADRVVDPGDTVQLNGAGSSDADGDTLAYLWSFVSLPPSSVAMLNGAINVDPFFVADVAGSYVLLMTVSDGVDSDSDTVVVNASAGGIGPTRPVADAGPDQVVLAGATAMLDGGDSSDPNGNPLTYLWTFIDWPGAPGGSAPLLDDPTSVTPGFVAADVGDYVLRLVVTDGAEDSIADTVTVTAQAIGSCADPLTLVTPLPFQPGLGEVATVIRIDGDDLGAAAADLPLDIDAVQVASAGPDQADFIVLGPAWAEFDRNLANPVSDTESQWLVIRRTIDDVYFRIDVEFTGDADLQEVRIDALSACRCGADPGDCP